MAPHPEVKRGFAGKRSLGCLWQNMVVPVVPCLIIVSRKFSHVCRQTIEGSSRMCGVAKVPVSLLGFVGWGCVRQTLWKRSQPSGTIRKCSHKGPMAARVGGSAKRVTCAVSRRWLAFFQSRRSTLETSIVILRCRWSTSDDVSYRMFFATCIVRAASSGDSVQIPWQAWDIVRVYFILLYSTPHTLHCTVHTLHPTLYTWHSALDMLHSTLDS